MYHGPHKTHSVTAAIFCCSVTTDTLCVSVTSRDWMTSRVSFKHLADTSFCLRKGRSSEDPFMSGLTRGKKAVLTLELSCTEKALAAVFWSRDYVQDGFLQLNH